MSEGGIHKNVHEQEAQQWHGSLFVFDGRMAIAPNGSCECGWGWVAVKGVGAAAGWIQGPLGVGCGREQGRVQDLSQTRCELATVSQG